MIGRAVRRWRKVWHRSARRDARLRDLRGRPFRRMLRNGPPPEALALMREQQRILDVQLEMIRRAT